MKLGILNQWLTVLLKLTSIIAIITFIFFLITYRNTGRYDIKTIDDHILLMDSRTGDGYFSGLSFELIKVSSSQDWPPIKFNMIDQYKENIKDEQHKKVKEEKRIADSINFHETGKKYSQ